jgi:hypothetical protein
MLLAGSMCEALAQEPNVEASIVVTPVETLRLADFDATDPSRSPLIFTVTILNDVTPRSLRVTVRVTGEQSGLLGSVTTELPHVHAGATVMLTNREFDRYDLADAASGVIDYATERGVLPPDNYRFHLTVADAATAEVLNQDDDFIETTNEIAEVHALSPGSPLDQAPESLETSQPVFLWQSDGDLFSFSLFEVTTPAAEASDIATGLPVFSQDDVVTTTFPYPSFAEALRPGATYAWLVETVVRTAEGTEKFPGEMLWFTIPADNLGGGLVPTVGLAEIRVSPQEVETQPGGAVQFRAEGYNANDESLGDIAADWEVVPESAGEVTSSGLFTATSTAGVAAVVATSGDLSDFATVTVSREAPSAAGGDSTLVVILYPSDSQILVEPSPSFMWHALNADSTLSHRYRLTLGSTDGLGSLEPLWSRDVVDATILAYPTDEPPLEPGTRYTVTVALVDSSGAVVSASDAVEFALNRDPKISWELYNAWDVAQRTSVDALQTTLLVLIEGDALDVALRGAIESAGGIIEVAEGPWVQLVVPYNTLPDLASIGEVRLLTLPSPHVLFYPPVYLGNNESTGDSTGDSAGDSAGDSDGRAEGDGGRAAAHVAPLLHARESGFAPIDVVVFEFGFDQTAVGDLVDPERVQYHSFRRDGRVEGSGGADALHGAATLKAMVEYLPPTATIHLVNFDTELEFQQALRFAVDELGARVLTCSVSWANAYDDYDGSSAFSQGVTDILGDSTALVVAAGNFAQSHWESTFADANDDGAHDFAPDVSYLELELDSRQRYDFLLSWDEWSYPARDLDLEILDEQGEPLFDRYGRPHASRNVQSGDEYVEPLERIRSFSPPFAGFHTYRIRVVSATPEQARRDPPDFEIYVYPPPARAEPTPEPGSSLASGLATTRSNRVIPVGAAGFSHSSRGPTNDGRIRPDFSADGALSYDERRFEGTSFATPRVAAALSSVFARHPDWSLDQALEYLKQYVSTSDIGKDNLVGWGALDIEALVSGL